jgi:arylsulfatase A
MAYEIRAILISSLLGLVAACAIVIGLAQNRDNARRPPNFVIIFADDLGYSDIGSFGAAGYKTPNLDRMAREGARMTDFYVAQAVCSASRAALLTGSYPNRVGIQGALNHRAEHGINDSEMTIAEILKTRGYATAIFGKWHLGHHPQFLPTRHGFDEYFGLPYSNDMWPNNPSASKGFYPDLPLVENEKVAQLAPDQTQLTTWYTEHAVKFIEKSKDKPFFLYLPHSMPHVPLFVSEKFKGKTERGLYGDVIEEIDWSVGQVLDTLKRLNLDRDTLVIFTSDNGPWLSYGNHSGKALGLREGKGTAFEGGVREPFVARWPGKIPAGVVIRQAAMTIDLLPTIAKLAGAETAKDRIIDGLDIWPLLANQRSAQSPHDALYFYWGRELHAVRSGKWKLHLPHPYQHLEQVGGDGKPGRYVRQEQELALFDLEKDVGETTNVAGKNPDVVKKMMTFVERARADLGDELVGREGKNVREPGRLAASRN